MEDGVLREENFGSEVRQSDSAVWKGATYQFLNGTGFLLLAFFLLQEIGLAHLGSVLIVILLSEAVTSVLAPCYIGSGTAENVEVGLRSEKVRVTLITASLIAAISIWDSFSSLSVFFSYQYSVFFISTISLSLIFLKCESEEEGLSPPAAMAFFRCRFLIFSIVVIGLSAFAEMTIGRVLLIVLVILCCATLGVLFKSPTSSAKTGLKSCRRSAARHLVKRSAKIGTRNIDLLLLPFIFGASETAIYLVARGLSISGVLSLSVLGRKAKGLLEAGKPFHPGRAISGAAARLNLGFFLVGGGMAVVTLGLGKIVGTLFGTDREIFSTVLFWLVVAHSVRPIFGAYAEIMKVAEMHMTELTLNLFLVSGIIAFCASQNNLTLTNFALGLAVFHLAIGAVSASVVACKFGIWPGPTALLFRQIRLL